MGKSEYLARLFDNAPQITGFFKVVCEGLVANDIESGFKKMLCYGMV
jgi:hypothetical protein